MTTLTHKSKSRLLRSALALLICISLLIGSTFAWFTDSVTSKGNIIQSGNLDIEMYWTDDLSSGNWYNVEDDAYNTIFSYDNWEPGYTDIKYIKLVNNGSLALNYKLALTPQAEVGKLAEVINVYFAEEGITLNNRSDLASLTSLGLLKDVFNGGATADGTLLANGQSSPVHPTGEVVMTIAMEMITTAGNEYQEEDSGEFTITALATQAAFEEDSFGSSYDGAAEFPVILSSMRASAPVTNNNGAVADPVVMQGEGISAYVPAGVALKDGTDNLVLTVVPMKRTTSEITAVNREVLIPVDVHIEGIAEGNTVPIIIELGAVMPKHLNLGNYSLIHVEDGVNKTMTLVDSVTELTAHNSFVYDSSTGAVTVAMASFSEVAVFVDNANVWQGNIAEGFAGGDGTAEKPYLIANADQLAYMNELISNQNETYGDKHYRLLSNLNINGHVFYPIGYRKTGESANKAGEETWYTYGGSFRGTFDGAGHTISGIHQNTWAMDGDYDNGYWNDAMGLFGYVYGGTVKNLTISDFYSEGEFAPTGCITAYAGGNATFENIAVINSHPQTYNTGVSAIVGWDDGGDTEGEASSFTFKNITVDETTTVSALWGSWDVAAAGFLGYLGEHSKASFEDCHVSATIDVYNDVCGNYQYYWYRYCGAFIGTVDKRVNGNGDLDLSNVTATDCTVAFGDRHEYYYCEFVKNTQASYTHDHQMSRVPHSELNFTDANSNGIVDEIEHNSVTGCKHDHAASGKETINGEEVFKEDKQAVYIPFRQLFGGYGWGVDGVDLGEGAFAETIKISEVTLAVEKFEVADTAKDTYDNGPEHTITIGELFQAKEGANIRAQNVQVTVYPYGEFSTAAGYYTADVTDWTKGTLEFSGTGKALIIISDYVYCKTTSIIVKLVYPNIFPNGDFEGGYTVDPWKSTESYFTDFTKEPAADGTPTIYIADNVGFNGSKGLVLEAGWKRTASNGGIYLRNLDFDLKPNTTYLFSFVSYGSGKPYFKTNDNDNDRNTPDFDIEYSALYGYPSGWMLHQYEFTTGDNPSLESPYYSFYFRMGTAVSEDTIIDNIEIRQRDDYLNLLPSDDFDDDAAVASVWAQSFFATGKGELADLDGNKALEILPSTTQWTKPSGTSTSGNGYIRVPNTLKASTTYELSFKIKGAPIDFALWRVTEPITKTLPSSDDWTPYTFRFTTSDDMSSYNRVMFLYRYSTATLNTSDSTYIDDITLYKVPTVTE